MNFLKVFFVCAGCAMFGAGCMMETDALSYDSEFFRYAISNTVSHFPNMTAC